MVKINEERAIEKEITEQVEVEKKLKARKKAEKTTVEKKKGQSVGYVPARRLPKIDAPDGYRPAWKHNTPENVRRYLQEGWIVANRLEHGMDVNMGDYYRKINDKPVSEAESTITHNEMICMLLPEEMAQAREEYYRKETEDQTRAKLRPEDNPRNASIANRAKITTNIEIN